MHGHSHHISLFPNGGFTLLEFLLAMLLTAIVTVQGVAGMQRLVAAMRMNTNINNVMHAIHEARSRALATGSEVILCPSIDKTRCTAGTPWQRGWLLFATRVAGRRQPGAGDITLQTGTAMTGLRVAANRRAFVLRPFGLRSTNGTLTFCDRRALVEPRALVISYTGKPRLSRKSAAGKSLNCPAS